MLFRSRPPAVKRPYVSPPLAVAGWRALSHPLSGQARRPRTQRLSFRPRSPTKPRDRQRLLDHRPRRRRADRRHRDPVLPAGGPAPRRDRGRAGGAGGDVLALVPPPGSRHPRPPRLPARLPPPAPATRQPTPTHTRGPTLR